MELSELGKPLTVKDMADLLGVSTNTVRRHKERWGGVEVAPGLLRFFENIVMEKIYANETHKEGKEAPLERCSPGTGDQKGKTLSRRKPQKQASRHRVGKRNAGGAESGVGRDPHGLLP